MKKITTHSKSGLFLMEMIFSLLILSLAAAACIRIFAAADRVQREAREWNHIQELTTTAGEILEGSDGKPDTFLELMEGGTQKENTLTYLYDRAWTPCSPGQEAYTLTVSFSGDSRIKEASLVFLKGEQQELYTITLCFPRMNNGKEVSS